MATIWTGWTSEQLERIGESTELELASRRANGTFGAFVTMWVVRVDDNLYVRSAYGPDNPWYRRAIARGSGRIRAGGMEADVTFAHAADDVHGDVDAAYHAKYDRYGPQIVGTVVGQSARQVTIRLVPIAGRTEPDRLVGSRPPRSSV
jgi:hypothetical protein